jgi:NADPH:quinone reductase-like Zn-dependent oxidoreductase
VKAAGIRQFRAPVEFLELPEPRALRPDEVLIEVRACGMGNWDQIARNGGWDLGTRPPMALGVEAAGIVAAVGDQVDGVQPGDRITAHSLPLREQGAWAERYIAAGEHVAVVPAGVPFDAAAALMVPVGDRFPLDQGAAALARVGHGAPGSAVVLLPGDSG